MTRGIRKEYGRYSEDQQDRNPLRFFDIWIHGKSGMVDAKSIRSVCSCLT